MAIFQLAETVDALLVTIFAKYAWRWSIFARWLVCVSNSSEDVARHDRADPSNRRNAAEKVGLTGEMIGIDISSRMLAEAERRRRELGVQNVRFELRDGHAVKSVGKRFDAILCVSAMAYFSDPAATLKNWSSTAIAAGRIAFTALEEGAFVSSMIFSRLAVAAGVSIQDVTEPLSSKFDALTPVRRPGFATRACRRKALGNNGRDHSDMGLVPQRGSS